MKVFFAIGCLFLCGLVPAQEVPVNTEQQLENLAEESIEDDALLQQLGYYQKNPLNLNTAGTDELQLLRFLTDLQIDNLLNHRRVFGKLLSIYELQAVPGFDLVTIRKLLPFVYVGDAQTMNEAFAQRLKGGSRFVLLRTSRVLEKAKGYHTGLTTPYLGNRNQVQLRQLYQYKNLLYYGLVADKDAGEQFFRGAQKTGFDFYSAHLFVRNLGRFKAIALGDYAVNLGQGLTQWQSLAFGKSAEAATIKRQAPVLLPYRSAGEFYFNRGAAASLQLGPWQATAFASYKKISGNLATDSVDRFTSFGLSGYHRTASEVADRHRIGHFSAGANLSYYQPGFKVGLNAVMHRFSLPLQPRDEPYNYFALSGRQHFLASIDYSYTHRNLHLFGELATDKRFHRAIVQGALLSVDPKIDLSFLYRNIDKAYQSPFGNAFTENALPGNEQGFYTGVQLRPVTGFQLSAYADVYHFPFLKFRVSAPTRGWDYLAQLTYLPNRRTELYLRYRTDNKPINGSGQPINFPLNQERKNVRLHLVSQVTSMLTVKARTELSWFAKGKAKEQGFLAYLETACEPSPEWKGNLRLQYFETGGFDSRIYAYESDVLYSFSSPAFAGKGFRYYVNLSHQLTQRLTLWLRLAQTVFRDRQTVGSGLDEINGPRRTDLRLQARYQLE